MSVLLITQFVFIFKPSYDRDQLFLEPLGGILVQLTIGLFIVQDLFNSGLIIVFLHNHGGPTFIRW